MRRPPVILTIALVGIICLIAGYLLGGLIYAKEGDAFFALPGKVLFDYQALIGGMIAIIAALIGFAAIREQVVEQRRQSVIRWRCRPRVTAPPSIGR